ncbi:MAG: response regulator transcription factor [Deltaproteobacteria bacterium]
MLRDGLRAILSDQEQFEVVGEAADGIEAVRGCLASRPDLMLLDLSMPRMNGTEVIHHVKASAPEVRILVLTLHRTAEHYFKAVRAGADGYVLKDAKQRILLNAIRTVLDGQFYVCEELKPLSNLDPNHHPSPNPNKENTGLASLTKREREILKLVAEGFSNKEIAAYLFISPKTVDNHRTNLMRKLDLHSAQALTSYAMRLGFAQ